MVSKETIRKMAVDQGARLSEAQIDSVKAQLDKLHDDLGKVPYETLRNVQPETGYQKKEAVKR